MIVELDATNKADMLAKIDRFREEVESGMITGFVVVATGMRGGIYATSSVFPEQHTAMMGALQAKVIEMGTDIYCEHVRFNLGLE